MIGIIKITTKNECLNIKKMLETYYENFRFGILVYQNVNNLQLLNALLLALSKCHCLSNVTAVKSDVMVYG